MEKLFRSIEAFFQQEKMLLLFGSGIGFSVLVFLEWIGALPLDPSWFIFLSVLAFLGALYRPAWVFLFLITWLPLETVLLAPESLGGGWRPYQWLAVILALALIVRKFTSSKGALLFQLHWLDYLAGAIPGASLVTALVIPSSGSLRLAIILCLYFLIYLVGRCFWRSSSEVRAALPFFLLGATLSMVTGYIQVVLFMLQLPHHMVMPGRPNATFHEPDWYGLFLLAVLAVGLVILKAIRDESHSLSKNFSDRTYLFLLPFLLVTVVSILLTVSRSAWIGAIALTLVGVFLVAFPRISESKQFFWRESVFLGNLSMVILGMALLLTVGFGLTRFDLGSRALSTATGFQKITLACLGELTVPERIQSLDELVPLGCQHITLEEQDARVADGLVIRTTERPDPNVVIRRQIYQTSLLAIREHPFFGIGWGAIGDWLGRDERGAALNASNIFLEIWLGGGLLGISAFLLFVGGAAFLVYQDIWRLRKTTELSFFIGLTFIGLLAFDMFNSGFLLGWMWIFFALIPLIAPKIKYENHRN